MQLAFRRALRNFYIKRDAAPENTRLVTDDALLEKTTVDLDYIESMPQYQGASLIIVPSDMRPKNSPRHVLSFEDLVPIANLNISNIGTIIRQILQAA